MSAIAESSIQATESVIESATPDVEPTASVDIDTTTESTESDDEKPKVDEDDVEAPVVEAPPPPVNDENAYPLLAGATPPPKDAPVSTWGPAMTTKTSSLATAVNGNSIKPTKLSTTTNEVFHIAGANSIVISKADFSKLITDLKKKHDVSIESTLSAVTQQRNFVISGKTASVSKVKTEILRRLTKPVSITFKIPAQTRSAIIGAGGKNLKPIIEATGIKVDIERNATPSLDSGDEETIAVSLEGHKEGCELAKFMINKIVKEETKNLTLRITVPDDVRAFIKPVDVDSEDLSGTGPGKNGVIVLAGLRDSVLAKKAELTAQFETLSSKLKTEAKVIPAKLHQFINASDLLAKHDVLVKFPTKEGDESVLFIGLPKNLPAAIAEARSQTSSFAIDALDISRAHGANVNHARALAAYFEHSKILKEIGEANGTGARAAGYKSLSDKDSKSVIIEITAPSSNKDAIKSTRKAIVDRVNALTPSRVLFVTDVSSFFAKRVVSVTEASAKSSNVYVVPLSQLSGLVTDDIILIALDVEDEEFAPSQEEIDARLQAVNSSLNVLREAQADLKSVVLDVPSEKQQFIEGPNGTTLKSLLAAADDLVIKLHSNGETESADNVFIQGTKSAVGKTKSEIEEILKDSADLTDLYSFVSETYVPVSVLSRLIGKNGANLKSLKEQFVVDLDFEKNPTGEKASLKLKGYKFNVKEAEQHITQLSKRLADEITKTLIVPKKHRSSLIGSNGKHVKKLETKYNVRINFSQSSDEVVIRGPTRGATKAEEELKQLLDFEIENGYTKEIAVPQSAIARVIGRSGDNIDRIIVDTGCDIHVNGDDKDAENRTITLTGTRKSLTAAEKQILAIVKEVEDTITVELEIDPKYFKDILGSRGSNKQQIIESAGDAEDKDYRKLLQIPEAGSGSNKITSTGPKNLVDNIIAQVKKIIADKESAITETISIPKEKHRLIIGPSGSIRRSLEEDFGVEVSIPRAESKSDSISIIGLPENVEKAKAKVVELTADDWKVSIDVPANLHAAISERGAFSRRVSLEQNVEIDHGSANGKARKLSSKLPTPTAEVRGTEEETIKFTVVEDSSSASDTGSIPWRLKGDDEEVAKVEQEIKNAIEQYSQDDRSAFLWVKNSNSVFRKVVGPHGSNLARIRKKSGAQIYVPRNTDKDNDIIILRGTNDSLAKADALLRAEIGKK